MKNKLINIFLAYLRIAARIQLKKINPRIIGIGGSSGKSSLTQLTGEVLQRKYKIKESKGKNSETGIPLSILDLKIDSYDYASWIKIALKVFVSLFTNWKKYDIYIAELGIDSPKSPKNMDYLLKIVQPDIAVLTNIQIEHSLYFDSLVETTDEHKRKEEILQSIKNEESLLLTSVLSSGRVVLNLDDENIKSITSIKAKIISVSQDQKDSDFYISSVKIAQNLFQINFIFLNENYSFKLDYPLPEYYSKTIMLAIALSFSAGVGVNQSIEILEQNFKLPAGRFSLFKGIKGSTIVDSSYNSSLEPTVGVLRFVNKIADGRRKVGILGDMRELGSISKIQHEAMAKEIINNLDFSVLIGIEMKKYVIPILESKNFEFKHFDNFKQAKDYIKDMIRKNDFIVIKGSQNNLFLERAVEILLKDTSDSQFLARRGTYWDKVRHKTP